LCPSDAEEWGDLLPPDTPVFPAQAHAPTGIVAGDFRRARAALTQGESRQTGASEWQDIATHNGSDVPVDLWTSYGERIAGAKWTNGVWREWGLDGFDSMGWVKVDGTVTHWMPLPAAPTPADGDAQ